MGKLIIVHIGNPNAQKNMAICEYQQRMGHEIHFIPTRAIQNEAKGVIYHPLNIQASKLNLVGSYITTKKMIRKLRPDILHAHHVHGAGWLGAFAQYHPLILHVFGSDVLPEQGGLEKVRHRLMTKYALKSADKIIVTGKHMISSIGEYFHISTKKIVWLPRGIDLDLFKPHHDVLACKKKFEITDQFPVVFSPRYLLDSVYNIDIVIEAIKLAKQQYGNILLLQLFRQEMNDGSKKQTLLSIIERHGLARHVKLIPMVRNHEMPEFYNASDMCVSVPSSDGFPVTVLEASGCGTPLIVSNLPFVTEYIENNENGLIVPVRDARALADSIVTLAGNRELRDRFSATNRAKVEKEGDVAKCMDKLLAIYGNVVRRRE